MSAHLTRAARRLNKAGGDVCRALGVYAETPGAAVVNELVRAGKAYDAEALRAWADRHFPLDTPTSISMRSIFYEAAAHLDPDKE